jgi:hypothetical protein
VSSTTNLNGKTGENALKRYVTGMLALAVMAGLLTAFPIPPEPGGKTFHVRDIPPVEDKIYGQVTEALSGTPLDGVLVNITSNRTGRLWSNMTTVNELSIHGVYNTGNTLPNIKGDLITVEVGDENASGFRGSANAVAEEDGVTRVDLTLQDISAPDITDISLPAIVLKGSNVNLSARVSDNFRVNTIYASITPPNQTQKLVNLSDPENDTTYAGVFNETQWEGTYNVIFLANDSTGNEKTTSRTFNVNATIEQTNWLKTLGAGWNLISTPIQI